MNSVVMASMDAATLINSVLVRLAARVDAATQPSSRSDAMTKGDNSTTSPRGAGVAIGAVTVCAETRQAVQTMAASTRMGRHTGEGWLRWRRSKYMVERLRVSAVVDQHHLCRV